MSKPSNPDLSLRVQIMLGFFCGANSFDFGKMVYAVSESLLLGFIAATAAAISLGVCFARE